MRARLLFAAAFVCASAPALAGADDVVFADPADPVLRALYSRLDPRTGFTPVAEPDVAAGRGTPRAPGTGDCQPGFRIAEPRTKDWSAGDTTYLLTTFLVTTDAKPGVPAPCYQPEAWICVLDRKPDRTRPPVDCLKIQRDDIVFPLDSSLDTARFSLNEAERAFGVRFRSEAAWRWGTEIRSALVLFRLHGKRLSQVLAVPMSHALEHSEDADCARDLILSVEKTQTAGFYDWRIQVGKKTGREPCEIPGDPVGTYRWDGARYVKTK